MSSSKIRKPLYFAQSYSARKCITKCPNCYNCKGHTKDPQPLQTSVSPLKPKEKCNKISSFFCFFFDFFIIFMIKIHQTPIFWNIRTDFIKETQTISQRKTLEFLFQMIVCFTWEGGNLTKFQGLGVFFSQKGGTFMRNSKKIKYMELGC